VCIYICVCVVCVCVECVCVVCVCGVRGVCVCWSGEIFYHIHTPLHCILSINNS